MGKPRLVHPFCKQKTSGHFFDIFRLHDEHTVLGLPFSVWYGSKYVIVPFSVSLNIYTENRTNGKLQLPFVCCKRKTETANFRLYCTANGNRKRNFVFLGQQMINSSRRLLYQPACPSMMTSRISCDHSSYQVFLWLCPSHQIVPWVCGPSSQVAYSLSSLQSGVSIIMIPLIRLLHVMIPSVS